jgi:regulator of sigma E protease
MSIFAHVWSLLSYIVPFIFVLSLVVFIHELGHFLVGRWCGVKVDAFSLGFGPELFSFTDRKGTRWRIAALPLGGYVKFHGDANGASMTDDEAAETMSAAERSVTFFGQPVAKRAAIVAAGPIANFLLAIVIFAGTFYVYGRAVLLPRIDQVQAGSPAEIAGFKPGDMVISIGGKPVESFNDLQRIVSTSDGALSFRVERAGRELDLVATPRRTEINTPFGKTRAGVLGISANGANENWSHKDFGLIESAWLGVHETWFVVERTGSYLAGLVLGRESADQLSGPIRIAEVSGEMAKIGFAALLNLAAILSISVGLLNLMPVPLLDGGHLLYYAFEAVRGRALNQKVQEFGFRVGMTLVGALMVFATYNDIARIARQWFNFG